MTILTHGRGIASVRRTKILKIPASARVIDGTGKFVIPGLWDMHMHFRDANRDLKMDIANGVLGIRNMGGIAKEVFPLRDAIAAGQRMGPKIVACGPIVDGPDSWSNPQFTVSVKTADDARSTVRSLKEQGADYQGLRWAIAGSVLRHRRRNKETRPSIRGTPSQCDQCAGGVERWAAYA